MSYTISHRSRHSIDSIDHRGVSDLTDPDGFECFPVVAECEEEIVLAVG